MTQTHTFIQQQFSKLLLFVFFILMLIGAVEGTVLLENLKQSQSGDYLIAVYNKHYLLTRVVEKEERSLWIEEWVVPVARKPRHLSWDQWLQQKGPCHTSRGYYLIDLNSGKIISGKQTVEAAFHLFSTLLTMPLQPIPEQNLRRTGSGTPWRPKLRFENNDFDNALFNAYMGQWPNDGSELSGKQLELYILQDSSTFPNFFPHWIQIHGLGDKGILTVIDSGHYPVQVH